jgi:uncharacterized protein (TIGR02466 family)
MLLNITPELSVVFGTPMVVRTVPNFLTLNAGLERAILSRAQSGIGTRVSNVGGWQSLWDFLDWPEPAITLYKAELDRGIQAISSMPALVEGRPPDPKNRVAYTAYGWANVNQHGHYNRLHIHTACDWSVVYYVSPGEPKPDTPVNGRIEFRDPRPLASYSAAPGFTSGQPRLIKPHAGLMVVFPAWIEHWVHPFYGEGNRISIAVNVTLNRD